MKKQALTTLELIREGLPVPASSHSLLSFGRSTPTLYINLHPSSDNGEVQIVRFKQTLTIEVVQEPLEIYCERLQSLWDMCDSHRHWQPLRKAAAELGYALVGEPGNKRLR